MFSKLESQNCQIKTRPAIEILLATSDTLTISQFLSLAEGNVRISIKVWNSHEDLLFVLSEKLPNLLVLGWFDGVNCFDLCQQCHQRWNELPIVLVSKENLDFGGDVFRRFARSKGAKAIISNNSIQIQELLTNLSQLGNPSAEIEMLSVESTITGQDILTALNEISEFSQAYFGELARGNYWRKSHDRLIDEFPMLRFWSADYFGGICCDETLLDSQFSPDDWQVLQVWVDYFVKECNRIIIDFGHILQDSNLSPLALLLLRSSQITNDLHPTQPHSLKID
jgi:hypothetical protein